MSKVLSIIVPSYNVQRYLPDSLASYCADGADPRLEIVIVNDGSSDSTQPLAEQFVALYPNLFKLVNKENGGHGSAINAGIAAASGRYVRVIDADDRICTLSIAPFLDELEACDDDLVVDMKREVNITTGAQRLLSIPDDIPERTTLDFESVCIRADIEEFFMIHTATMRTALLREHDFRLLEHTFYVDYELIVKVGSYARTIRFVRLEGCNYYVGNDEQSVAPANYVKRWGDHTRVTEELLRYVTSQDLGGARQAFLVDRVRLLVNTHYNIALIYDTDRARGLARAKEFRAFLESAYPQFAALTESRYKIARVLHGLGVTAPMLDKLMRR